MTNIFLSVYCVLVPVRNLRAITSSGRYFDAVGEGLQLQIHTL